jgi:uncharacterized protein YndB with AHSA1/START domain
MTEPSPDPSVFDSIDPALKVVSTEIDVEAPAEAVFELIADPGRQPEWDGNDNLGSAPEGQRVRGDRRFLRHDADQGRRSREPYRRLR